MVAIDLDTVAGFLMGHYRHPPPSDLIQPIRFSRRRDRALRRVHALGRVLSGRVPALAVRHHQPHLHGQPARHRGDRDITYDLYVDGALFARKSAGGAVLKEGGGFTGDDAASVTFTGLPPAPRP